ncbi:LAFA_0G17260g1_1 [Lachancea sp. 'fantastica']|nr:LAFA_0G17260g1_1 [Lachancea sp. 'fantastica']
MGEQESLSIEETNKLRISLGLKPIEVPARNEKEPATVEKIGDEVENKLDYDKSTFIDPKVSRLRWNLKRAKSRSQGNTVLDSSTNDNDDDSGDWIANVKLKNKRPGRSTLKKDYFEDNEEHEDLQNSNVDEIGARTRVEGQISNLLPGKDVILTLKESELDEGETEDTLVNEGLAHDQQQAKNMRLKRMNQERKRRKTTIGKGSMNNDDDENEENSEIYMVDGKIVGQDSNDQTDKEVRDERKIDIVSRSDSADDSAEEEPSDFAAVKIKKRKKLNNNKAVSSKRTRLTDSVAPRVALIDEDAEDPVEDELQNVLKIRKKANRGIHQESLKTPEQIAKEVEEERKERASRIRNINHSNGITIDENSTFLSSLTAGQQTTKESAFERTSFQPVDLKASASRPREFEANERENNSGDDDNGDQSTGASLEGGLAATLGFLRDRNVIPGQPSREVAASSTSSRNAEIVAFQQQQEARKVRNRFADELTKGSVQYSKEELESLQQLQEQEINDRNKILQRQKLADYNPEVNLTYKDDAGNVLTTKEAYKKLSQAFHGTRSNRKKQAKAQQKVLNRNKNQGGYV